MFGIIDGNNFFVSCERVFNPKLRNIAVVVLSNNDGCAIARSNEAKALGIKMGTPYFQLKHLVENNQLTVCSGNGELYQDMSSRVMSILSDLVPYIEPYSIDEAFLHLNGIENLRDFGTEVVRKTAQGTGIPMSLGIAATKTLCKIASKFAKKYKAYNRVCIIDTEEKRIKALQLTKIGDVWGIGPQYAALLEYHSVKTAYDLTLKSRSWVRKYLTVVGERTWLELHGTPCIKEEDMNKKKQIQTSRSFGEPVSDFDSLMESVANFAAKSAAQLRQQKSVAQGIIVSIRTNRFNLNDSQYKSNRYLRLSFPTSETSEIVQYCRKALLDIYKEGYRFKKAGVILTDIKQTDEINLDLFDEIDRAKQNRLSKAIDAVNNKAGFQSVRLAIQGVNKGRWNLKKDFASKCYSTKLSDIIEINCKK